MIWDLRKPLISLVKSSLVFVLVGGCRLAPPHFFGNSKKYHSVTDSTVYRRTYQIEVSEDRIYTPTINNRLAKRYIKGALRQGKENMHEKLFC